jgi:hypothetical protein
MARFYGEIGYGSTVQTPANSGIWKDTITERQYYGDIIRNIRRLEDGEGLNNDITLGNSISVLADEYANNNFFDIKYVRLAGTLWTVTSVEVKSPRLILSLGSVYNGPTA